MGGLLPTEHPDGRVASRENCAETRAGPACLPWRFRERHARAADDRSFQERCQRT